MTVRESLANIFKNFVISLSIEWKYHGQLALFFTFIRWCCANTRSLNTQEQQQQKDPNTQIAFSLGDSPVIYSLVSH